MKPKNLCASKLSYCGNHKIDIPIPKMKNRKKERGKGYKVSPKSYRTNNVKSNAWRVILCFYTAPSQQPMRVANSSPQLNMTAPAPPNACWLSWSPTHTTVLPSWGLPLSARHSCPLNLTWNHLCSLGLCTLHACRVHIPWMPRKLAACTLQRGPHIA